MKKITRSILLLAFAAGSIMQGQELLPQWDADGATGAGSEANMWGWAATDGGINWNTANGGSGVRYRDGQTLPIYGGTESISSRLLYIRWDANTAASTDGFFSLGLPASTGQAGIPLDADNSYTASGHILWWANADAPSYAISISTANDGSVAPIATDTISFATGETQMYKPFSIQFSPDADGEYYLLFDQTAGYANGGTGGGGLAAVTGLSLMDNGPLGLASNSIKLAKIYPNPAQNVLNIQSEVNISNFKIYDIQGRVVAADELSTSERSIDISGLNKGSYLLELASEDKTQVIKFLK